MTTVLQLWFPFIFLWPKLPITEEKGDIIECATTKPFEFSYKYFQKGDLIIGEVVSLLGLVFDALPFNEHPDKGLAFFELLTIPKNYQHVLSFVFAVKEINNSPKILPNISLGFHIYDSYTNARMTHHNTLKLLSVSERIVPNFKCGKKNNLVAVIGGLDSEISLHIASLLENYKIAQLANCVLAPVMSTEIQLPFFYRLVPSEAYQYKGIVQLLLHFHWIWVGIIASDDDNGDTFVATLVPMLSQHNICPAFSKRTPPIAQSVEYFQKTVFEQAKTFSQAVSKEKAVIVCAEPQTIAALIWFTWAFSVMEDTTIFLDGKVWIMTAQWDFTLQTMLKSFDIQGFHGSLSFAIHSKELLDFTQFLQALDPKSPRGDGFLRIFWEKAFDCSFSDSKEHKEMSICGSQMKLESLPGALFEMSMTGQSYSIYNAVHVVAHALSKMYASTQKQRGKTHKRVDLQNVKPWQIHPFLKNMVFNNSAGDTISFDDNGELAAGFDIINWVTFPNQSFIRVKIGRTIPQISQHQEFIINDEAIIWPKVFNQVQPLALCNGYCYPGFSKKIDDGRPFCCYSCILCPDEMISDQKDMDNCFKCPEDKFPNKLKDKCIEKTLNFLSFLEPLGITLAFWAVIFMLITVLVLGVFIKHKDTPVVKANNRELTYSLLISLKLCFLCALIFIGRPHIVTCILRQTALGIIFSVVVACILAKTMMVILAFMATKPGSRMRKWMKKRMTSFILFSCSCIQAIICVTWLSTAPPFPHFDMHSLTEEIVVECNEGSPTMFYCVLGYMGLLAMVSFIVAFFARKLPDSFNEAKFITFSMLVFCSVWLSFVPSYLSTKGKYMVAVEIFSILASGSGLLCCIFAPKCYIIILRPDLNKKDQLIRRKR